MTLLEWGLQILLLAMLGAAIPFALRLERALREIRADRSAEAGGRTAAAAAARAGHALKFSGRACAGKSYPHFFRDFNRTFP